MIALLEGRGAHCCDVGAAPGLGHAERHDLLAGNDVTCHEVLQVLRSVGQHWGQRDGEGEEAGEEEATRAAAGELVGELLGALLGRGL